MIEKFKYNKETLLVDIQLKLDEIIDFVNEIAQIESDILLDISNLAEDLKELEAFVTPLAYKPYCCNNCKEYIKDIPICGNVNCSCHKHLI